MLSKLDYTNKKSKLQILRTLNYNGQVGFPESPEITEITENFTEVTNYLTKLKENINKLCLEKISRQKAVRIKFALDSAFLNMLYEINRNQQKALLITLYSRLLIANI